MRSERRGQRIGTGDMGLGTGETGQRGNEKGRGHGIWCKGWMNKDR